MQDRILNICKSVNEVSKWDGFYKEYSERISEVTKQFSQASRCAVSNLKNIPIISDITTGAISRFQNKMAEKSPNFKRVLHSRSQSHIGILGSANEDTNKNAINDKRVASPILSEESESDIDTISLAKQETCFERAFTSRDMSIDPIAGNNTTEQRLKPKRDSVNSLLAITLMPPESTQKLYRNLSLPHILEQQKKLAQLGKVVNESHINPRFKEKVNLPELSKKNFIAKDVIDKFQKDEARCKCSSTFRYKR